MKGFILSALLLVMAVSAHAQPDPAGAATKPADGVWFLNSVNKEWSDYGHYPDTLSIGSGVWTRPFRGRSGYFNLEGVGILTAATDSFKYILYGSNSQWQYPVDTTMLTRLDSGKVLAAGLYHRDFLTAGKYAPWLVIEFVPLNPGATITAKTRRTSIGIQ